MSINKVKFYTDEHIALTIVKRLRREGIDVLPTQEAQMLGSSDEERPSTIL